MSLCMLGAATGSSILGYCKVQPQRVSPYDASAYQAPGELEYWPARHPEQLEAPAARAGQAAKVVIRRSDERLPLTAAAYCCRPVKCAREREMHKTGLASV